MKCISKGKLPRFSKLSGKKPDRKKLTAKDQARQVKKIRKTLFLIGILAVALLAGGLALFFFIRGGRIDEPLPYSRNDRVFGSSAQESSVLAEGMAEGLCVGPENQPLDGIDSREGEMAGLFDIQTGQIPFSQGIYQQKAPGSLTQLMTLLVASEALDPDTSVVIEQEDLSYGLDKTCGLSVGDTLSARQLLNAAAVYSAQDACMALARAAGGNVSAFVDTMNSKAQELGMTSTRYANPTGVPEEEAYTTVYDTYLLFHALLKQEDLVNALGISGYTLDYLRSDEESRQRWLDSDNLYVTGGVSLPKGVTVLGGKISLTDEENYGALLVQDDYGNPYVAVVLDTDSSSSFYERMDQMLAKISP